MKQHKVDKQRITELSGKLFKLVIGAVIFAVGIEWFFVPVGMISGGVTGIAMIINRLTGLPVGTLIIVINIPLFIIALKKYGYKFIVSSITGVLFSSVAIDLISLVKLTVTTEPLLAAIYGGINSGLGLGLIFSAGATTGGTDLVSKFLRSRYSYINFGTIVLALDAAIISVYALVFREYDLAMFTVIGAFIASRVIDLVLYGFSQSKLCYIISEKSQDIKCEIVAELRRGVTMLQGKGAYSGMDKQILLCVVKRQQIVAIRKIVKSIDQKAFVIVTDTRDVFGEGFGDIGDYE